MNHVKKRKKHPYLLLELLIALALLALFLGPMLGSPLAHLRNQKKEILNLYLDLEGEKILFAIEEQMRTGLITWDMLIKNEGKKTLLETLKPFEIPADKTFPLLIPKVYLSRKALKQDINGIWIGTVRVTVEFTMPSNKTSHTHRIYATFFISKKKLQTSVPSSHLASKETS